MQLLDSFFSLFGIILTITLISLIIFLLTGLVLIRDNEVGIRTKKMFGPKMPQGQIIARDGEIGIQADTLMPGLYWFNPITWKIDKVPIVDIGSDEIGIVESIDGVSIPTGRLLGDVVECNQYQDARAFLENGGMKGPEIGILRPGQYRINTKAFIIQKRKVTKIDEEKIGVVVALDGKPMLPGFLIAPKPTDDSHNFFQDGAAFIRSSGYRGPQLDTLQPGDYYINPLLFEVTQFDIAEVPPGYVAVLRSNIGEELDKATEVPEEIKSEPDFKQEIHEKEEVVLTTNKYVRGIWKDPVAPGKYNMNPLAFTAYLVPTSAVTIDWAAGTDIRTDRISLQTGPGMSDLIEKIQGKRTPSDRYPPKDETSTEKATEFFKFSQLKVTSKDGFQLDVDVRLIIRIRPQHAAFIIARFGSVANLIEQIVHPLIDSSFRNNAGEKKAIDFIQSRTDLQKEAIEKAREEFDKYYVEAQNLLIAYIAVDKELLATQTKREIAVQQQEQYKHEAKAQEERIAVQEKTARAEKQKEVIDAKLSIDIATDNADAARREAEGVRDATKYKADGIAYEHRETGKGIAEAYTAQVEAIGQNNVAMLKLFDEIAKGNVKIVPDFLVTGGKEGNMFNAWMAMMMSQMQEKSK